jgi:predicted metal-dependent hydrolase
MSEGGLQLSYGEGLIEFQLERRDRKTLAISVKPDLGVEVVAPVDAPMERIFDKVRKRAPWIQKQLRFYAQFQPWTPKRQYLSGETHLYLGRQYKLKVVPHIAASETLSRAHCRTVPKTGKQRAHQRACRGMVSRAGAHQISRASVRMSAEISKHP